MTKEQLIAALESFPSDAKILVFNGEELVETEVVAESEEGHVVIYAR